MHYFHPLVWKLLANTVFSRAASFMTLPFLAIYLQNHLHTSPILIGVAVGISELTATFAGFFGGFLTDRFGRKKIILLALIVWSFVFYGFAVADSVWLFIFFNAINGLCRAFFEPASQALMIDYTALEKRRRLFSIRYTFINLSAVIGPLLGVYISQAASMTIPFMITATMYFMSALYLFFVFRQVEESTVANRSESILHSLRVLTQNNTLLLLIIASIVCTFIYSQTDSTMSQLLNTSMANGVVLYSVLIAINAITVLLLQLPLGILSERVSIKTSLISGALLMASGMLIFNFSHSWGFYIAGMIVFSLGEIFVFPMMGAVIEMIAPAHQKATYLGVMQLEHLGGFLGPIIGGLLIIHMPSALYAFMAALSLIPICCYLLALRKTSY